jgi:hypothetical protein
MTATEAETNTNARKKERSAMKKIWTVTETQRENAPCASSIVWADARMGAAAHSPMRMFVGDVALFFCKANRKQNEKIPQPQKRQKTGSAGLRKRKQIDNLFESARARKLCVE